MRFKGFNRLVFCVTAVLVIGTVGLGVTLAQIGGAYNITIVIDAVCGGAPIACGNSSSPDCDPNIDCIGITSITVPVCTGIPPSWGFHSVCEGTGMECQNGHCDASAGNCHNSMPNMCSSTSWYWWPF